MRVTWSLFTVITSRRQSPKKFVKITFPCEVQHICSIFDKIKNSNPFVSASKCIGGGFSRNKIGSCTRCKLLYCYYSYKVYKKKLPNNVSGLILWYYKCALALSILGRFEVKISHLLFINILYSFGSLIFLLRAWRINNNVKSISFLSIVL